MTHLLNAEALDQLFREARTHNAWLARAVSDDTLRQLYDLMRWGPTSANTCPARFLFLRSQQSKERLRPALAPGNVDKTMTAPVTVVIAYDLLFYEKLPKLFPHTRECLALQVDTSFASRRVTRVLEQVIEERGHQPVRIRCDNGPEFTSRHFLGWCKDRNIELAYIQPGRPMQNGRLESLNGKVRDEFLNVSWFLNLFDARRQAADWRRDYNEARPHSSLAYRTPAAFAKIAQGLCSAERRKGPQPPAPSSAPPSPLAALSGQVDVVH